LSRRGLTDSGPQRGPNGFTRRTRVARPPAPAHDPSANRSPALPDRSGRASCAHVTRGAGEVTSHANSATRQGREMKRTLPW